MINYCEEMEENSFNGFCGETGHDFLGEEGSQSYRNFCKKVCGGGVVSFILGMGMYIYFESMDLSLIRKTSSKILLQPNVMGKCDIFAIIMRHLVCSNFDSSRFLHSKLHVDLHSR